MYEVACSEILHLYHDSGKNKEATSPQLCQKLSSYNKGSKIIAASEKQYLGLKLTEGNKAIYFKAYKRLSGIIFQG